MDIEALLNEINIPFGCAGDQEFVNMDDQSDKFYETFLDNTESEYSIRTYDLNDCVFGFFYKDIEFFYVLLNSEIISRDELNTYLDNTDIFKIFSNSKFPMSKTIGVRPGYNFLDILVHSIELSKNINVLNVTLMCIFEEYEKMITKAIYFSKEGFMEEDYYSNGNAWRISLSNIVRGIRRNAPNIPGIDHFVSSKPSDLFEYRYGLNRPNSKFSDGFLEKIDNPNYDINTIIENWLNNYKTDITTAAQFNVIVTNVLNVIDNRLNVYYTAYLNNLNNPVNPDPDYPLSTETQITNFIDTNIDMVNDMADNILEAINTWFESDVWKLWINNDVRVIPKSYSDTKPVNLNIIDHFENQIKVRIKKACMKYILQSQESIQFVNRRMDALSLANGDTQNNITTRDNVKNLYKQTASDIRVLLRFEDKDGKNIGITIREFCCMINSSEIIMSRAVSKESNINKLPAKRKLLQMIKFILQNIGLKLNNIFECLTNYVSYLLGAGQNYTRFKAIVSLVNIKEENGKKITKEYCDKLKIPFFTELEYEYYIKNITLYTQATIQRLCGAANINNIVTFFNLLYQQNSLVNNVSYPGITVSRTNMKRTFQDTAFDTGAAETEKRRLMTPIIDQLRTNCNTFNTQLISYLPRYCQRYCNDRNYTFRSSRCQENNCITDIFVFLPKLYDYQITKPVEYNNVIDTDVGLRNASNNCDLNKILVSNEWNEWKAKATSPDFEAWLDEKVAAAYATYNEFLKNLESMLTKLNTFIAAMGYQTYVNLVKAIKNSSGEKKRGIFFGKRTSKFGGKRLQTKHLKKRSKKYKISKNTKKYHIVK
jgi:hypothetical protein